jgi:hypothetical protein
MTPAQITTGTQTLTAAGPAAGSLDISNPAPHDYMLEITVLGLSAAAGSPKARIVVEDSVDAFAHSLPVMVYNIEGPITPDAPVEQSWNRDHIPSLRIGQAGAVLRVNVVDLDGTTPSISLAGTLSL